MILPLLQAKAWTAVDTTGTQSSARKSPAGAVLRSFAFPGWGQWYNEQKLKAVVVFAGEAALAGNIVYYHQKMVKSTEPGEEAFYRDYRSQFIWYLVGAHLLSMLDAYVDANLWDFDTGPDLSCSRMDGQVCPRVWRLSLKLPLPEVLQPGLCNQDARSRRKAFRKPVPSVHGYGRETVEPYE